MNLKLTQRQIVVSREFLMAVGRVNWIFFKRNLNRIVKGWRTVNGLYPLSTRPKLVLTAVLSCVEARGGSEQPVSTLLPGSALPLSYLDPEYFSFLTSKIRI